MHILIATGSTTIPVHGSENLQLTSPNIPDVDEAILYETIIFQQDQGSLVHLCNEDYPSPFDVQLNLSDISLEKLDLILSKLRSKLKINADAKNVYSAVRTKLIVSDYIQRLKDTIKIHQPNIIMLFMSIPTFHNENNLVHEQHLHNNIGVNSDFNKRHPHFKSLISPETCKNLIEEINKIITNPYVITCAIVDVGRLDKNDKDITVDNTIESYINSSNCNGLITCHVSKKKDNHTMLLRFSSKNYSKQAVKYYYALQDARHILFQINLNFWEWISNKWQN